MEARLVAKRTRQQLLTVSALIWNARRENNLESEGHSHRFLGQNVYEVFNRLALSLSAGERPKVLHTV